MTLRIVCAAVFALLLVGCGESGDSTPSTFERFEAACAEMKGFVVNTAPAGWSDNGRYSCIVDNKKVYVPGVIGVLQ